MKNLFITLVATLLLTACGSNVDRVKTGTMEFNQTITIGQALDNWSSCQNSEWEEFETDNGVTVVEFTCHHAIDAYINKIKRLLKDEKVANDSSLSIEDITQIFQFTINKDDSFQIDYVESSFSWQDGKTASFQDESIKGLEQVYDNVATYDLEDLSSLSAAQSLYWTFRTLKSTAK